MPIPDEFKKPEAEETPKPAESAPAAETETTPVPTPEPETPVESVQEKSRYQSRIDQLTAARRAAEERARQAEDQLNRMNQQQANVVPGGRPGEETKMVGQMTKDDWMNWHDEDPLSATEYVSDIRANQKAHQIIGQMQTAGAYSETVSEVYKQHPELKEVMEGNKTPDEVPFWGVYDQVAKEMPEAQQIAKGPLLVMREAERRIKEKESAQNEKKIATDAAAQENARQQRVDGSYTAGSTPKPPAAVSAKLSDEEIRIARKMGMSPEEYAKNKKVK